MIGHDLGHRLLELERLSYALFGCVERFFDLVAGSDAGLSCQSQL